MIGQNSKKSHLMKLRVCTPFNQCHENSKINEYDNISNTSFGKSVQVITYHTCAASIICKIWKKGLTPFFKSDSANINMHEYTSKLKFHKYKKAPNIHIASDALQLAGTRETW